MNYDDIKSVIKHTKNTLFIGEPGTGKSTLAVKTAEEAGQKCYSVTLHSDMSAQELIGHYIPKDGTFIWHDGPAIRAWREGACLVLNEIDQASGSVLTSLNVILDKPDIAALTLSSGETVRPKEGFRAFGTMNGEVTALPNSLRDRFHSVIKVDCPSEDALSKLPEQLRQQVKNAYASCEPKFYFRQALAFVELLSAGISRELASEAVWQEAGREVLATLDLGVRDGK